jgi:hypothetical protein
MRSFTALTLLLALIGVLQTNAGNVFYLEDKGKVSAKGKGSRRLKSATFDAFDTNGKSKGKSGVDAASPNGKSKGKSGGGKSSKSSETGATICGTSKTDKSGGRKLCGVDSQDASVNVIAGAKVPESAAVCNTQVYKTAAASIAGSVVWFAM